MEVFVHIIKDLNRFLNLGLYMLVDSDRIMINSLSTGQNILEFNSSQTMDLYLSLVELKRLITSWSHQISLNKEHTASVMRGTIFTNYKFDINKHYQPKKYGNF